MTRFSSADPFTLLQITGIGETKLARYGQPFLGAIQTFREAAQT